MAISFPQNPTVGDVFTQNGRSWQWDGATWGSYGTVDDPGAFKVDPSNDRVGIGLGAATPSYTLDVSGDARVSSDFTVADTMHVDATNNRVGIGTTSPAQALEIYVNSPEIRLTNDAVSVNSDFYYAGVTMRDSSENLAGAIGFISGEDQDMRITSYRAGASLHLVTGGASNNRITITDTGNVGIGTTSPSWALDVVGEARIYGGDDRTPDANGDGHLMITGNGYTGFTALDGSAMWVGHNSGGRSLNLATDETARVTVTGTGNVGINDTTPSYTLDVNGDINTTGAFRTDGKKTGLVLVGSGDFSGVTGVDILNVFTSEFDNYQLHVSNVTNTLQEWIYFRLWQGGTLNSGANYDNQRFYAHITSVGGQKDVAISYGKMLPTGGNQSHWITHISSPALSTYTLLTSWGLYSDNTTLGYIEVNNTWFRSTTAATGIRFGSVSGSGSIAGRWELYGCPK